MGTCCLVSERTKLAVSPSLRWKPGKTLRAVRLPRRVHANLVREILAKISVLWREPQNTAILHPFFMVLYMFKGDLTTFACTHPGNDCHDYKLIWYIGYPGYDNIYELYDIEKDPEERVDLSESHSDIVISMANELKTRFAEADQPYRIKD